MTVMLIEVRPGEGGADAEAFADELFTGVIATVRACNADVADIERSPRLRTARIVSRGRGEPIARAVAAMGLMAGNHRVQRIPRGSASRHTSTATVAVLDVETTKV